MADPDVFQGGLQKLAQALGQVDRTVVTACAANRDGDIGAIAGGESRQPFEQITGDVPNISSTSGWAAR